MILHAHRQVLLVGKDQEQCVPQLVLVQHTLQFLTSLCHAVAVVAVDNKDDTLSVLEIMPPQWSDFVLSTNIPHGKLNVFVLDSLNIESYSESILAGLHRLHRSCYARENEPMVGMVVTISPSLSLYRIVVFPAASRPTIRILISLLPHSLSNNFEIVRPMLRA